MSSNERGRRAEAFPVNQHVINAWAESRTADLNDPNKEAVTTRVYHRRDAPRLPDWTPVEKANLVLNVRFVGQADMGLDGVNKSFIAPLQRVLDEPDFADLNERISVYPAEEDDY